MKHSFLTKYRRAIALATLLLLLISLAGCWKKDDPDSTEGDQDPIPSESTAATTTAPPETTQAPTEATTEAPTDAPTEPAVTESAQDSVNGTVTAGKLNIRQGAGSNYSTVGSYAEGTRVEILETKGEWGRTDKGWVNLAYVTLDKSTTNNTTTENATTNDEIVSDGKTTALGHGVVNLGTLNVRSGPGTNYEKVGTVGLGERYAYYQRSGNWARIKDGWVSVNYFYLEGTTGDGAGTGKVSGSGLNIRSGPGKDYEKVGTLAQGDTVQILAQVNSWGYTSKGWVSMSYIKMDNADSVGKGTITASTLNIREKANSESDKVGSYAKGDTVEILEVSGNWGRTSKGWISLDYVQMDGTSTTQTGTITANSLFIRKEASTSADAVGYYVKNDKITILETKDGWGRTDKGWISLTYVKMN